MVHNEIIIYTLYMPGRDTKISVIFPIGKDISKFEFVSKMIEVTIHIITSTILEITMQLCTSHFLSHVHLYRF